MKRSIISLLLTLFAAVAYGQTMFMQRLKLSTNDSSTINIAEVRCAYEESNGTARLIYGYPNSTILTKSDYDDVLANSCGNLVNVITVQPSGTKRMAINPQWVYRVYVLSGKTKIQMREGNQIFDTPWTYSHVSEVFGNCEAGSTVSIDSISTSGDTVCITLSSSPVPVCFVVPSQQIDTSEIVVDNLLLSLTYDNEPAKVIDLSKYSHRWWSVKSAMPYYSNNPNTAFEALRTYWATRMGAIVVDTTVTLTANTTVAASVIFIGGGNLNVDAGHILTFSSTVNADPKHFIFTGAGTYAFDPKSTKELYPYWFGAKGDNSNDDAQEIQKCVDAAISSKINTVRFLSGYHLISTGILIRNGSNTVTLTVEGRANYDADLGTAIVSTDSTNFVWGVQGARDVILRNMYLQGKGNSYNPTISQIITNTKAQWRAQYGRDDRYSPFCAFVLDPFKTTAPTGGGYPGFSGQYSNSHALSSHVILDNVVIRYFPVGVMISPSGQNGNAAEITIQNCSIDRCEYGVATGNTQSRDVNLVNTNIGSVAACLDGTTFGGQLSPMPTVIGGQMSNFKDLLRYAATQGDAKFVGVYTEGAYRLGRWNGNSGATLNFNNCEIKFITSTETSLPDAASVLDAPNCKVLFEGGSLIYSTQRPVEMNVGSLHLKGVYLNRQILNNPDGNSKDAKVIYEGCQIDGYSSQFFQSKVEKTVNAVDFQRAYNALQVPAQKIAYYETGTNFLNTVVCENTNDAEDHSVLMESSVSVTVDTTARTAVFTVSKPERYRVGDILFAYNNTSTATPSATSKACSYGIITSIVGTTITCGHIPSGISSGTKSIYLWGERIFIGTYLANITSGSNKVVIVSKNTGNPTVAQAWSVGLRVYAKSNQSPTSGLYTGLYVTSVTADTLTLSGNVGSTVSNLEIFSADYRCTYYSEDNTYQTSGSTHRTVGYQTGDEILFSSHAYRARAIVTAGGFTPTVKFIFKPLTGVAASKPSPTSLDAGLTYLETDNNILQIWNGTSWTPASPDNSTTNEIQTLSGSGSGTTYAIDLSLSGGSVGLIEGTGVTIDRTGNNFTFNSTVSGTVTGTGVANQVTFWTGTSSIGGDPDWTFDGTDFVMGAGKTTVYKEGVFNNQHANKAYIGGLISGSPQYPGLWLTNATPSASNYAILADIGASATHFNAPSGGFVDFKIGNAEQARINTTGFGIGATPVNKLDVEGGAVIGATYSGTNTASTNGLLVEGNVAIGNTSASQKLHVTGNVRVTGAYYDSNNDAGTSGQVLSSTATGTDWVDAPTSTNFTRTLPTTVGNTVQIGFFTKTQGAADYRIDVVVPSSGVSIAKTYTVSSYYNGTAGVWQILLPITSTGAYSGNDFQVEVKGLNALDSLRIRRTAGTSAATAYVDLNWSAVSVTTFTALSGTDNPTTITATYSLGGLGQVANKVGINNTAPARDLHVKGEVRIEDLATDTPTKIVGADADGDLDTVGIGAEAELHLTNGTLGTNFHTTISPSILTAGMTNNWNPTGLATAWIIRMSGDDKFEIVTGITAPSFAKRLTIHNIGSNAILFATDNTSSTAGNRFSFGRDVVLFAGKSIEIIYDPTSARWRLVSKAGIYDDVEQEYFNKSFQAPVSLTSADYDFWTIGSTAAATAVAPTDGLLRAVSVNTGTSATGCGYVASKEQFVSLNTVDGTASWGYVKAKIVTPSSLSDGTNDYGLRIGFLAGECGSDLAEGAYFYYNHSINSGAWSCYTQNAGSSQNNNSGITVAASTIYTLEVVYRPNISVEFFINGTRVATNDMNVPDSDAMKVLSEIEKQGGTSQRSLQVYLLQTSIAHVN